MTISSEELAIRQKCKDDFEHYASRALRIRPKEGQIIPLTLNTAQRYLHGRLEKQLREKGRVRAIILKGRQQGCSTYVEGRYYWRVTHRKGVRAFILTHEQEATNNLFEMVNRYHEYCNPLLKPTTDASNAKELIFGDLDSGYKLGTAGTKGTGRSSTVQFFHGSEVAFWPNADEHAAGVMQAIPDSPGTEVILESTANGMGNYFHRIWQMAEAGLSDYEAIFIPWFWQEEYRRTAEGFSPSIEEQEYAETYGLSPENVAWMRWKLAEFRDDWALFHQEYPATPALAFQSSGEESYIPAALVMKARKATITASGHKIGGLDIARFGDDRTALVIRQGRKIIHVETWTKKDTMEVAGIAIKAMKEHGIDKLFADVGGLGAGVYDRLKELGYGDKVIAVNSGEKAIMEPEAYINRRAEMWGRMKEWLADAGGADIPNSDTLQSDLTAPSYTYDSNQRVKLERKEDIKKRGTLSPDLGDAVALTFAMPIGSLVAKEIKYNLSYVR